MTYLKVHKHFVEEQKENDCLSRSLDCALCTLSMSPCCYAPPCCYELTTLIFRVTSYEGYILSTLFMTVDIDLDHLTEVVFVRVLHCKVTLFLPLSILYSGRKYCTVLYTHRRVYT